MSAEDARIRIERAPNRCPYCHDTVRVGEEEWVACAECLARHHAECWSDVAPARCAACGGEASLEPRGPARPTARARPQVRIDPAQLAATARQLATNARGQVAGTAEGAASEPYYGSGPWVFGKLLVALGIGAALYHALMRGGIGQTSALFVGLPAILAVVMLVTPSPRTSTGTVLKTITLLLAISGLVFAEGIVCILMAAPLFLLSGLIAAKIWDWMLRDDSRSVPVVAVPLLLFMSLEGTTPALTLPRDEVVTAERVVEGTPDDVARRLAARPRFATPPPFALALGFPNPTWTRGEGLAPGDERVVHLVGGEGDPGDLVLRVEGSGPGFARFDVVSDTSHMPHYLDWEGSEVRWEAVDATRTRVRWSLRYTRRLDPAWYFAPCERWAAGLAVGWLVDALASPAQDRADAGVPERAR